MEMSFRWYRQDELVTLQQIREIPGMQGIVTAVYDIPVGGVWPMERIEQLKKDVERMAPAEGGLLMNYVGMLTDSRSFILYTRHEYFRRLFCDYIGDLVERGEIPNDEALLEKLIINVSYNNAVAYFDDANVVSE